MLKQLLGAPSPRQAVAELIFGAFFWGFGFIATRWGLESLSPLWLNGIRFTLAFVVCLPILLLNPGFRKHLGPDQWLLSSGPGLFLGAAIVAQTYGLQHTTVTKSGFITTLYVVIVPIFEAIWLKGRIRGMHWLMVVMALVGTGMMCELELGSWNIGDLLTFLTAIFSTFQILLLEIAGPKVPSSFVFNLLQTFWAAVIPLGAALATEKIPSPSISNNALFGVLFLAFGSTLIAFLIQVRAQKVLPPSTVSMLFLLESVLAAAFAYLFFHETLNAVQSIGALMILVSAAITVRSPAK